MPSPLATSPKREQVLASLEGHRHRYDSLISTSRPRLFVSSLDARGQIEGDVDCSQVLSGAKSLLLTPLAGYVSKEEDVQRHNLEYSDAKQELWLRPVGDQIFLLTFALRQSGSEDFREYLKALVLTVCRFPSWGIGWKRDWEQVGDHMDLACAHVVRAVAMAWDWHSEIWEQEEADLIATTVTERAGQLLRGSYGAAFWAESHSDNHNHVTMCALAWCGLAFYREIPEAPEWLAAARLNFQSVARHMPTDGASHEGVPYWSYGLSYILQYVEATKGCLDSAALYDEPFLQNAAAYRLHASTSGFEAVLPWGDARTQDYYGPHFILHRLAAQYGDANAAWLAERIPFAPKGFLDVLVWDTWWRRPVAAQEPRLLDHHCRETDLATTRSGWTGRDYLLAIKAGFTNRNHSHLDAGALVLAFGSEWLLTAPGYGSGGSGSDFWDRSGGRWRYFSNATESHSTLLIEDSNQSFQTEARGTIKAFLATASHVWTSLDLAKAYPQVKEARRIVMHARNQYIVVFDDIWADRDIAVEWLAQVGASHGLEDGALLIKGSEGNLRLEMLVPDAAFAARSPNSPKIDVPAEKIHTYAVKRTSREIGFVAFLQPLAPKEKAKMHPHVLLEEDRYSLSIAAAGWNDEIVTSRSGQPIPLRFANPSGPNIVAAAAVLRTEQTSFPSGSALRATQLNTTAFTWTSPEPSHLAWQCLKANEWIVEFEAEVAMEFLQPTEGFVVSAMAEGTPRVHRYNVRKN